MHIQNLDALLDLPNTQNAAIEISTAIFEAVSEKGIDCLSEPQRVFYYIDQSEREVNNGGFHQYFSNSSGDYATECGRALVTVGLPNVSAMLDKASKLITDGEVPKDRQARNDLLDETEDDDDCQEAWNSLDEEYYSKVGDLSPAVIDFVRTHRNEF
jgi:hypothetical protein